MMFCLLKFQWNCIYTCFIFKFGHIQITQNNIRKYLKKKVYAKNVWLNVLPTSENHK